MRNPVDRLTEGLPRPLRVAIDWLVTIGVAVGIVLAIKVEVANPYRVPTASMEPTLHCGRGGPGCTATFSDRVIANRLAYRFRSPRRREIVVFEAPAAAEQLCGQGGTFVKRIVGLPGEVVSERDGFVYVNGRRLDEPYVRPERRGYHTRSWARLGPDSYFLMGDNRASSCDSRAFGPVPRGDLIGPVIATYWPPNRISVG